MKTLLIIVLILSSFRIFGQDYYIVSSDTLNIRATPKSMYHFNATLNKGDTVYLLENNIDQLWKIKYNQTEGWVYSKFLTKDLFADWIKKSFLTGENPGCDEVNPLYNDTLNSYLKIQVGQNTDAAVKLINYESESCIRYVYVKAGETVMMKNIPEGQYYLKIAYGNDWREKVENGNCFGKFVRNAIYSRGQELLDFTVIRKGDKVYLPVYTLELDATAHTDQALATEGITEPEFYE